MEGKGLYAQQETHKRGRRLAASFTLLIICLGGEVVPSELPAMQRVKLADVKAGRLVHGHTSCLRQGTKQASSAEIDKHAHMLDDL